MTVPLVLDNHSRYQPNRINDWPWRLALAFVFAIREAHPHPWVISTTRHLSQGGVSLLDERWDYDHKTLCGKSKLVIDDPYVRTVHLPNSFRLEAAEVDGAKADIDNGKEIATIRIVPSATKTVEWKMTFTH